MRLNRCLNWWRCAPQQRAARPSAPDWVNAGSEPGPEAREETLLGCGWFDSSHELQHGLRVTEHTTPERVANEVPLGWWLDWQSGAPRASAHASEAACG